MIDRLGAGDAERLRAIRLRALRDAPEAFATTHEEAAAWPLESWEQQLSALATFVATVDDRDVGLVRGARHDELADAAFLVSLWVAPEARRQGIGTALVGAVADWARTQRFDRLLLDVGERNASAIALYRRAGFLPDGTGGSLPPPREHVREIRMVLRLQGGSP